MKIEIITQKLKDTNWDNRIKDIQKIKDYFQAKDPTLNDFQKELDKLIVAIKYHFIPNDLPYGCYPDNNYGFIEDFKQRLKSIHNFLLQENNFLIENAGYSNVFINMNHKLEAELEALDTEFKTLKELAKNK